MSISKVRLPNNTEEDIKAKYLIQSTSADAVSEEFVSKVTTEDAIANIQKIYGNTIKWNQLIDDTQLKATATVSTVIITNNGNGTFTLNGTASALVNYVLTNDSSSKFIIGHKYLLLGGISASCYIIDTDNSATDEGNGIIYIATHDTTFTSAFRLRVTKNTAVTDVIVCPQLFDLTEIYGSGNEPSSVSAFRTQYPSSYYPYDAGSLTSNSATAILSRGFNQWDEEWEAGGINATTGQNDSTSNIIRAKNYTPVKGGQSYYIYMGSASISQAISMRYYDANKNLLGTSDKNGNSNGANLVRVMPDNCTYIRFVTSSYYGSSTTYLNDICINISDPAKNGTYESYNGHQIDLNIPTLTGKLNGTGSSVVIFPDGMGYDGVNRDELTGQKAIRKTKIVDMGTLTWTYSSYYTAFYCSSLPSDFKQAGSNTHIMSGGYTLLASTASDPRTDADKTIKGYNGYLGYYLVIKDSSYTSAASLKTSLSGVNLCYEITSPQEYILDNALQLQYPVVAGGTEMVLPTSGTAPMKMDVIYGNAADATSNLSSNFISVDSMKAFLNNLGTQMGGTWNMQYNNGKFEFTFSSS